MQQPHLAVLPCQTVSACQATQDQMVARVRRVSLANSRPHQAVVGAQTGLALKRSCETYTATTTLRSFFACGNWRVYVQSQETEMHWSKFVPQFQHPDLKDLKVARCAGIPVKEKLHSSSPLTLTTLARLSHPRNQEHFLSFRRSSQKHPQTLGRKDGRAVQQVSGLDQYTDHMLECSGSEFIVYWRGSDTSSEIPLRSFLAQETVLHVGVVWGVIMIALTVF